MKNDNSNDIKLIERYFDGEASTEEVKLFEQKLSLDPDFRAKAELHQKAIAAVRISKRSELRQLLQDLDDTLPPVYPPPSRWRKILIIFLFVSGLITAAIWWKNRDTPTSADQATLIAQHYSIEAIDGTRRGKMPLQDVFLDCMQATDYNCVITAYVQLPDSEKGFEDNQLDYAYALIQVDQCDKAIQLLQALVAKPAVNLQKSRWYLSFAYLKSGDKNACREVLKQIDRTHYRNKARAVLEILEGG